MDYFEILRPQGLVQWTLGLLSFGVFSLLSFSVLSSRRAGLSHIPGPFVARYTNAWSLYIAWLGIRYGHKIGVQRKIRAQYGDVVRTGPRSVTVFDPAAVPVIYGVRSKLEKVRAFISTQKVRSTT